ncbi:MAG: TonB-dependent receptor [Verrucomicrobiota bacterium]
MPRVKKDSTKSSLTIAIVAHVLVFLVIFVWAAKTGRLDPVLRVFNLVPTKKPEPPKEKPKPPEPKIAEPKQIAEPQEEAQSQPPATQALTTSAPNPNAPPALSPGLFQAEKRVANARPVPFQPQVIVGKSTGKGTGTGAGAPSLFSKEATKPSTVASVLEDRRAAVASQDAISSEQITKSTASDAAAVVSKISGASIVEGKFVVVRGLSDRYNTTTLNGADLPTADPYRKAAQLDLIPSAMIDRIIVNKTFTPDQPGGFAGGAVNVVTKSFPEKPFASVSIGGEYNTQSSLNENFLSYHGGSTDWLGIDDGTRALPGELENANLPTPPGNAPRNQTAEQAATRQAQANSLARLTQSFQSTQFAAKEKTSPLNQNFSISMGDTALFAERPFGVFASLSYKRDFNFYGDGVSARYDNALHLTKSWVDARGNETVNWAGAVSLAYQLHPNHELGFSFIYNQNSEDIGRRRVGADFTTGSPELVSDLNTLQFIQRQLHTFQLKGKHTLLPESLELKIDWLAAFSNTSQEEPDLRYFNYYHTTNGSTFTFDNSLPEPRRPTRYFRNLEEDNFNTKLDGAIPFRSFNEERGEIKAGAFYSRSERTYDERTFTYGSQTGDSGFGNPLDPNSYLNSTNLNYTAVVGPRGTNYIFPRYLNSELGNSAYAGKQEIQAAYLMTTLPFNSRLRAVGGARVESTDLSVASTSGALAATNTALRQTDLLPALSLITDLSSNLTLRLSYSQTITRPTYREIAAVRSYDLPTDTLLDGNPNLAITSIKNYDARLEWFPHPGEVFAVSVFYKDLKKPIEKYSVNQESTILTYINRDAAKLYGVEFEARQSLGLVDPLLGYFSVGANLSLIESEVKLTATELANKRPLRPNTPTSRSLYDQSPYIFNGDLNYDNPHLGTSASLSVTLAGPRIFFVNPSGEDIYEHPPTTLDFTLAQRLGRNLRMKFSAKNLLDLPYQVTYGNKPDKFVYTSYRRGITFGISLAYDF